MKTPSPPLLLVAAFLFSAAACSSDDDDGAIPDRSDASEDSPDAAEPVPPDAASPAGFALAGDVVGSDIPADADLIVLWAVSSSSPDYAYEYGDGSSSGPRFTLSLADAPPPDLALNDYGAGRRVGIGFVALVPSGSAPPEGVLDPDAELTLLGTSATPIIWREGAPGGDLSWAALFEEATYECGRCVPAGEGETFDTFEPVDCDQLDIDAPAVDLDCNFT